MKREIRIKASSAREREYRKYVYIGGRWYLSVIHGSFHAHCPLEKCAFALSSRQFQEHFGFRVWPFSGQLRSIKARRRESLNTAAISREGHQTARGPSTELWFPYAPIIDPSIGYALSLVSLIPPMLTHHALVRLTSLANNLRGAFLALDRC